MPNGGEHHITIGECPRCHSMRIHKRRGFHLLIDGDAVNVINYFSLHYGNIGHIPQVPIRLNMQYFTKLVRMVCATTSN